MSLSSEAMLLIPEKNMSVVINPIIKKWFNIEEELSPQILINYLTSHVQYMDWKEIFSPMSKIEGCFRVEFENYCIEAHYFLTEFENEKTKVLVFKDVTEIIALRDRNRDLNCIDSLTKLPNRSFLIKRINEEIESQQNESSFSILFVDIKRFHVYNEGYGLNFGDDVLRQVAIRLQSAYAGKTKVGRWSGGKFIILSELSTKPEDLMALASRALEQFILPLEVQGKEIYLSSSIGISVLKPVYQKAEDLIREAEGAARKALFNPSFPVLISTQEQGLQISSEAIMQSRLHYALENDEFINYYQPIYDIEKKTYVGCEALVRWVDPNMGMINPASFINIAEDTGLIVPLGMLILERACKEFSQHCRSKREFFISVNLSPLQLRQENLTQDILETINRYGILPGQMHLEITEGALVEDSECVLKVLNEINDAGMYLALDDFGTGFSSLSYLRRFPVKALKIDQSFTRGIAETEKEFELIKLIIKLANLYELDIVVEGVETIEQFKMVSGESCKYIQGFYLARPLSMENFSEFLSDMTGFLDKLQMES